MLIASAYSWRMVRGLVDAEAFPGSSSGLVNERPARHKSPLPERLSAAPAGGCASTWARKELMKRALRALTDRARTAGFLLNETRHPFLKLAMMRSAAGLSLTTASRARCGNQWRTLWT